MLTTISSLDFVDVDIHLQRSIFIIKVLIYFPQAHSYTECVLVKSFCSRDCRFFLKVQYSIGKFIVINSTLESVEIFSDKQAGNE
jgi:hypothetical protein